MAITQLPNGVGESTGDTLATAKPLLISGDVWYVHGSTGSDAYNGRDATKPLATLGQAHTNATSGDIIVLKDGHTETLTSLLSITKTVTIVGGGTSGGKPTVKLTNNSAAAGLLDLVTGGAAELRNIWFNANAQTNAVARVKISSAAVKIIGCYFECGATDTGPAIEMVGANAGGLIRNTTLISTATVLTAQPESAIKLTGGTGMSWLTLDGVVVDGGTVGWSNFYAVDLSAALNIVLRVESMSLLRGSDMKVHTSTTGHIHVATTTGGSRVNW